MRKFLLMLGLSALLATGCSAGTSTADGGDRVASVPRASGPGAAATANAVDVDDQRPLVRADTSGPEATRLYKTWEKCLVREGGSKYQGWGEIAAVKGEDRRAPKDAAQKACAAQQPETAANREQRTDPAAFKEDNLQMYHCAKAKGYQLGAPDQDTGEFGLTAIGPQGDFGSPGMEACRREAFGAK